MLAPADFILGTGGRLSPAWYEPHDLVALLTGWLEREAADHPGASEQLTKARVYRIAFTTAADLFMAEPASQRDRDKSSAYSAEQLKWWRDQAALYELEIANLTGRAFGPVLTGWEGDKRCGY